MRNHDLARFGSLFDEQLISAIAQQEPHVAQRLMAELRAGNYEVTVDEHHVLSVRIAGSVLLEAQLYPERKDARLN